MEDKVTRAVRISLAVSLLLGVAAVSAGAGAVVTTVQTLQERELRAAQLQQMAVQISSISNGEDFLLFDSAAYASPNGTGGRFLAVYPVSSPVLAVLTFKNEAAPSLVFPISGKILGAVSVITSIWGQQDKTKAAPGAYLIFAPFEPIGSQKYDLVAVSVSADGKPMYKSVASTLEKKDLSAPKTTGELAARDVPPTVTASIDGTRAEIILSWGKQVYKITFTMDIAIA